MRAVGLAHLLYVRWSGGNHLSYSAPALHSHNGPQKGSHCVSSIATNHHQPPGERGLSHGLPCAGGCWEQSEAPPGSHCHQTLRSATLNAPSFWCFALVFCLPEAHSLVYSGERDQKADEEMKFEIPGKNEKRRQEKSPSFSYASWHIL